MEKRLAEPAIDLSGQRQAIVAIRAPTLVIAGTHDLATSAAEGRAVAEAIQRPVHGGSAKLGREGDVQIAHPAAVHPALFGPPRRQDVAAHFLHHVGAAPRRGRPWRPPITLLEMTSA